MASGDTGNVVPGNRLRVRISCPPLELCYSTECFDNQFAAILDRSRGTILASSLPAASALRARHEGVFSCRTSSFFGSDQAAPGHLQGGPPATAKAWRRVRCRS
jgi:hypothetical protein